MLLLGSICLTALAIALGLSAFLVRRASARRTRFYLTFGSVHVDVRIPARSGAIVRRTEETPEARESRILGEERALRLAFLAQYGYGVSSRTE